MKQRRTLSLRREALTELGPETLGVVVGAAAATAVKECLANTGPVVCFTDRYRTTCLNCE
ncbi:MAG TPA: hypothetical protein VFQ85_14810 [Mycobacteriales bacterium]|jgi:hypothetical protein|nr:hypothetical protein [Mycobacteriales bacterium]